MALRREGKIADIGLSNVAADQLRRALPAGTACVTEHPVVTAAAESAGKTPAQVGLAWLLGHDPRVLLIPGTTDLAHLEQNLAVADFALDAETTADLDALGDDGSPGTERGSEFDIPSADSEAVHPGEPA